MGDPVTNQLIIEEALAQASLVLNAGEASAGDQFDYRTANVEENPLTGEVREHEITGSQAHTLRDGDGDKMDAQGGKLRSDKAIRPGEDAANARIVRERIKGTHRTEEMHGGKVIMKANPDGTVRTITDFPNEGSDGQTMIVPKSGRKDMADFDPFVMADETALRQTKDALKRLSAAAGGIGRNNKNRGKYEVFRDVQMAKGPANQANTAAEEKKAEMEALLPDPGPARDAAIRLCQASKDVRKAQARANDLDAEAQEIQAKHHELANLIARVGGDGSVAQIG